jgi:hypothetical protein
LSQPDAQLTVSSTDVVAAVGGTPRTLTITNNGPMTATGLSLDDSEIPSGTVINAPLCTNLDPQDSCTVTIHPGVNPNNPGLVSPTPAPITIDGTNTNTLTVDLTVLTKGNIFQGGYVFAFDNNTPSNQNVGGSVVQLSDLKIGNNTAFPFSLSGDPTSLPTASNTNGLLNTQVYVQAIGPGNYAAYHCTQLQSNDAGQSCTARSECYKNWYLPARCQLTTADNDNVNCPNGTQAVSGVNDLTSSLPSTNYWTSNYLNQPAYRAWNVPLDDMFTYADGFNFQVRCTRDLSY